MGKERLLSEGCFMGIYSINYNCGQVNATFTHVLTRKLDIPPLNIFYKS